MLVHIAIYKWKEGSTPSAINQALEEVKRLQEKVPGLQKIYCGENFSKWAEGYTHAIVVVALNQEALNAYRNHPDHTTVAHQIEAMEERGIGVDFFDA